MPKLPIIREENAKLVDGPPLVVVLAGGTTGIGSYVADAFADIFKYYGHKLRVYIVGRNASRAEAVISKARNTSPKSEWQFVKIDDLALISDVDRACEKIAKYEEEHAFADRASRIDLLYMSYCYPILKKRSTTKEGLDAFLSTVYYSRIRFITQLMPLLTASPLAGHAISIYAGGFEDGTKPGELPIGCPPDSMYGVTTVRKHASLMKTFMFEEFARKNAGKLRLSHIYPGLVDGPGFYNPEMPPWFRYLWRLMKPLAFLYMTSSNDCGQVMVYLATSRFPAQGKGEGKAGGIKSTSGEPSGGCYALGQRADGANEKEVSYSRVRKEDTHDLVWKHTMETFVGLTND